ncbi:MAG: hypothetical protein IJ628_08005 [Bacteroidaceae bacterium]|nr:hypothetical protein [Bacteroidaceae bacterium]
MRKLILMLATLPLLAACSADVDNNEPDLIIDPVINPGEMSLKSLLHWSGGVGIGSYPVAFDPTTDAIDNAGLYEVDEPYQYPNKPGYGSGWNELAPEEENLAKTQVPQELVEKMTTRALVETCIEHPMAFHYMRGEDYYRKFITRLLSQNNAFKELAKRPDAGWELVIAYNDLPFAGSDGFADGSTNKHNYAIWGFVELLIENDTFFSQLTKNQLAELYKASSAKYFIKERNYPYLFTLLPGDIGLTMLPFVKTVLKIGDFNNAYGEDARKILEVYVNFWDPFTTTTTSILQVINLTTGSDMKVYDELDVQAHLDKLLGKWRVTSFGHSDPYGNPFDENQTITFKEHGVVELNWLAKGEYAYTINGNTIKMVSDGDPYKDVGYGFGLKVTQLTESKLECYAWPYSMLSSWGGSWFVLEKTK